MIMMMMMMMLMMMTIIILINLYSAIKYWNVDQITGSNVLLHIILFLIYIEPVSVFLTSIPGSPITKTSYGILRI